MNDSKWRRMASDCSKKLPALLREITSKDHGDFYCLNSLHSLRTEDKCGSQKKYEKIKTFIM